MRITIQWDETRLSGMSAESRDEALGARDWLLRHFTLSQPFIASVSEQHPALWFDRVMELVEVQIQSGDPIAIELGCLYLIEDPKAPFGRIHKRHVIRRLKARRREIPAQYQSALRSAGDRMTALAYKPQEYKHLMNFIRALDEMERHAPPTESTPTDKQ